VALLLLPDALLELLEHLVEVELPEGLALLVGELPDLDRIAQPGEQLLGDLLRSRCATPRKCSANATSKSSRCFSSWTSSERETK
jgi:hypothetical protein